MMNQVQTVRVKVFIGPEKRALGKFLKKEDRGIQTSFYHASQNLLICLKSVGLLGWDGER